jgi:hypothetical protein
MARTLFQQQHETAARSDKSYYFKNNNGHPQNAAVSRPMGGGIHQGPAAGSRQAGPAPGRPQFESQAHQSAAQSRSSFQNQPRPAAQAQTRTSFQTKAHPAPQSRPAPQSHPAQQAQSRPAPQQHSAPAPRGEHEHK